MTEQRSMFDIPLAENEYVKPGRNSYTPATNPMLIWGEGPEGATCKTCAHRYYNGHTKKYQKCGKRDNNTNGSKTDIRAGWRACKFYKTKE